LPISRAFHAKIGVHLNKAYFAFKLKFEANTMIRNSLFWWILIGLMVLLDLYFFQAIKAVSGHASARTRTIIYTCYWFFSISAIIILLILPNLHFESSNKIIKSTLFALIASFFLGKLIASVFFLFDDLRRGAQWITTKIFTHSQGVNKTNSGNEISRSVFISWMGLAFGGGLFSSLLFGFGNKYRYQVKKVKLTFKNLPPSFRGLKIVHISDIHSGSFNNKDAVVKGVVKIMNENPDLILFTGDLVNNLASEMDDYMDVFDKLHAPLGVFSTLGNHDYGDYFSWDSPEAKKLNLDKLKAIHEKLGWRLLMNEHVLLEKDDERIVILGIENWSAKSSFTKYGDLSKAYSGTDNIPFKILMSHDPSHWKAEVCENYPDIDLMLSGHTHGMQFGVEIPGFKWSPVQYIYKEWAGLYEKGFQKLYVNRGFGFIGYPGRVGILPEITVLELT